LHGSGGWDGDDPQRCDEDEDGGVARYTAGHLDNSFGGRSAAAVTAGGACLSDSHDVSPRIVIGTDFKKLSQFLYLL
jgi:hypothetical protein